jgi:hypothetical protein
MNLVNLLNLSTILNIALYPEDSGKCVMKSILIDSKHEDGIGKG